jgi:hypothetical protein
LGIKHIIAVHKDGETVSSRKHYNSTYVIFL